MANRFIFPVGGTPESVRTQIGAVGPAPDPGSTPAPVVGEVLTWDGSAWVPGAGGGGGITQLTGDVTTVSGSGPQPATVARLNGNPVSSAAPADGQVLTWNGSVWVPGAAATGGSGGGGQIYFLNAGTAGEAPVTNIPGSPLELGLTAEAGQTTVVSGALPSVGFSLIAGFVTKVNSPNLGAVPAGLWDFNVWAASSAPLPNGTSFRIKIYVYDPTALPTPTLTLLATSAATQIYDPSQTIQYVSSVVLPQTAIATTDRIYVEIEGNSTSGADTITTSFGGTTPSHGLTTLPSVAGSGIIHVINGVIQSPASPVDLTAGATEISGTLPVGNGGTGTATTPTDGQILIGNTASSNYALAAITQGTNVTITNGAGSITIDAVGSIAALTGDVTASGSGSVAATVAKIQGNAISSTAPTSNQILQWISGTTEWTPTANGVGLGSKVLLVVEGGAYATIQAAIDAAADNDVILVGPKAAGGSWGPAAFSPGKRLVVASLGSKWSTQVRVDSITFNANSGLNILLNTVFVRGLFINSSFTALAPGVNFFGSAPARLRLQECFIYNNNAATGTGVVSNNSGTGSSLYIDNCIIQSGASTGIGVDHQQGYTNIRGDSEISGYQYPLQCARPGLPTSTVEILNSVLDGTGIANEVVRITGGLVTLGYSTIKNTTANASGVNLTAATATLGMGDATFAIGAGSGYCVRGVASTFYLYGNVTYSNSTAATYNTKVQVGSPVGSLITAYQVAQAFTNSA